VRRTAVGTEGQTAVRWPAAPAEKNLILII
jgi:hypothetical protein